MIQDSNYTYMEKICSLVDTYFIIKRMHARRKVDDENFKKLEKEGE